MMPGEQVRQPAEGPEDRRNAKVWGRRRSQWLIAWTSYFAESQLSGLETWS